MNLFDLLDGAALATAIGGLVVTVAAEVYGWFRTKVQP